MSQPNRGASLKHRHARTSWLICGGRAEWCYVCGAFRNLKPVDDRPGNVLVAASSWFKPSGNPDVNPAMK